MEEGCAAHAAAGTWFESSLLHRLAADAAMAGGDRNLARRHLEEGFAVAHRIDEAYVPDEFIGATEFRTMLDEIVRVYGPVAQELRGG